MIPTIIILVIVGAVVYYSFNRPKAKKSSGSSSTSVTPSVYPPFGEPGEYSFQPREFEGSQYVWKDGQWYKTK